MEEIHEKESTQASFFGEHSKPELSIINAGKQSLYKAIEA
jgi:hypothetical protein